MTLTPRTLIVIPARGGSKGIPRKNTSPLAGRPLMTHVIRVARAADNDARVVVSTDDAEIACIARRTDADVVMRDPSLATDAITLDPVVHDAVLREEAAGRTYDHVVTIQPTSPLLRPATVARILRRLEADEADTILTAVDDTHLAWGLRDGVLRPEYESRLNRQFLPARYRETGGPTPGSVPASRWRSSTPSRASTSTPPRTGCSRRPRSVAAASRSSRSGTNRTASVT
jgi:CMP-N-acetylneuraminic acid synthetase